MMSTPREGPTKRSMKMYDGTIDPDPDLCCARWDSSIVDAIRAMKRVIYSLASF